MANTRSAAKQARVALRRRDRNRAVKETLKKLERQYRKAVSDGKPEDAKQMLPALESAFGRAAKRKVIHSNKASRKTSRLTKLVKAPAA